MDDKNEEARPIEILLVEDNPGDMRLTKEALKEGKVYNNLHWAQDGVEAVSSLSEADLRLVVLGKVFGVDRRRRDLILLYYSEKTMGQVQLHMTFYEQSTGRLLASEDAQGLAEYSEVFWLYIFGPFRSQK